MHSLRQGAIIVVAALSLSAAQPGGGAQRPGAPVAVQILAINDLHGNLEPPSGANGQVNSIPAGGVEYLATHLKNAAAENPNTVIVAAGDLIGASPLVSAAFHDEPTIEAVNAMRLAVSSVGNHEFDEGIAELLRMQHGGCHPRDGCQDGDGFAGAAFQYLSANVVRTTNGATLFPPVAVRTVGGVKIGFIGATLKGTSQIVSPEGTRGVRFLDEASTANRYAAQLARQGVRAIVLLIHEGGRQHSPSNPDPNGCADFSGAITPIVEHLGPAIQVILSAHSHTYYNCRIGDRLVTNSGAYGRMFTRLTLDIDPSSDRILRASAVNQIVTRDVPKDPAQTRILQKYGTLVESIAEQVVGSVAGILLRATNEAGESPLGNVIADAQLAAARPPERGGAVVAFMNIGGIRADLIPNDRRTVTYRDLYEVQPFGNTLAVFTMTGAGIKQLLEQQFDNPFPGHREMLQVSDGFTYRHHPNGPPGQRVDPDSIRIDGRKVEATDRIRVVANDFLLGGGDAFTAFAEATDKVTATGDLDALIQYFRVRSPVTVPPLNRILLDGSR